MNNFLKSDLEWIGGKHLSMLSYDGYKKLKGEEAERFKRLKESKVIGLARDLVYITKKGDKLLKRVNAEKSEIEKGIRFEEREVKTDKDDWRVMGPWSYIKMKNSGHYYMRCKGMVVRKKPWKSFNPVDETKSLYNETKRIFKTFKYAGSSVKLKPRIFQRLNNGVGIVWLIDKTFRYRFPIQEKYFDMVTSLHPNATFYTGRKRVIRSLCREPSTGRYYMVALIMPYDLEKHPKPNFEEFK